jgi:outer membrane biosynthesis protein TonB
MSKSTFISAALHTAILLWVLVAFPAAKIDQQLVSIPIDLASPSEVTKLKAGTKDAKDDAPLAGKPKEKQPEAVKEVEAKKPEQTAAVEQKSGPEPKSKPEEKKADTPKPAAPKAEEARAAEAEARLQHRPDCRLAQQDPRCGKRGRAGAAFRRARAEKGARPVERHGNDHVGE